MPVKLDNPIVVSDATDIDVTSFTFDVDTNTIFIGFNTVADDGTITSKDSEILTGNEALSMISSIDAAALKNALYDAILAKRSLTGTIV